MKIRLNKKPKLYQNTNVDHNTCSNKTETKKQTKQKPKAKD